MFDLGFEDQIRSLVGQIRPDRQTLLFSATFRRKVEVLARDILVNPIKVVVGTLGQSNENIRQEAVLLKNHSQKWGWLSDKLSATMNTDRMIIFVSSKQGAEDLAKSLGNCYSENAALHKVAAIHGDKDQRDRSSIISQFKKGTSNVLVATDVAARGLDIQDVRTVVNYDAAKSIETHVHRIGRTGRMGKQGMVPGVAYTLLTKKDAMFAGSLVNNFDVARQKVPPDLLQLAQSSGSFSRRSTVFGFGGGGGGGGSGGGGGGGGGMGQGAAAAPLKPWQHEQKKGRGGLGFGGGGGGSNGQYRGSEGRGSGSRGGSGFRGGSSGAPLFVASSVSEVAPRASGFVESQVCM
jgi:ATP-dependent RNA helicase DDX42